MLAKLTLLPLIAAICFTNETKGVRWLLFGLAAVSVIGCINTGSRTPLIAVCLAYGAYLVTRFRFHEIVKSAGIYVAFGTIFLIYLGFANPEVVERFSFEGLSVANNSDEGDRIYLYQIALEIIRSNPMGIGLGNFSTVFWINAPHNIYLESLAELGYLGTLPLLVLTWIGLKSAIFLFKLEENMAHFYAMFFMYNLVTAVVGNELTLPSLMFYLSIGLASGYAYLSKRSLTHVALALEEESPATTPAPHR